MESNILVGGLVVEGPVIPLPVVFGVEILTQSSDPGDFRKQFLPPQISLLNFTNIFIVCNILLKIEDNN